MYQERQVREHASLLQMRWAMVISTISKGNLFVGGERFADVFGEARPEQDFRIVVMLLYQTRIASNLMIVTDI